MALKFQAFSNQVCAPNIRCSALLIAVSVFFVSLCSNPRHSFRSTPTRVNDVAFTAGPSSKFHRRLLLSHRRVAANRFVQSQGYQVYPGWQRLNDPRTWSFLLGSSPFSFEEDVDSIVGVRFMENLVWIDGDLKGTDEISDANEYPDSFAWYLSRFLLARDERCTAWWNGASANLTDDSKELLFARFQASVAASLSAKWRGHSEALAYALIFRFGGRFPFDAERQVKLCFSLLPDTFVRTSFFDQDFPTERDELEQVFVGMDRDGNGMLSFEEIRGTFQSLGTGFPSIFELSDMMKDAQMDSHNEIDLAGFRQAVLRNLKAVRSRIATAEANVEWWRDPSAPIPEDRLDEATSETLSLAYASSMSFRQEVIEGKGLKTDVQVRPLQRERPLDLRVFLVFMLAGSLACTVTHIALVPIDVVKTLQQSQPAEFQGLGLFASAKKLWCENGPGSLFLGLNPTMVGYTWYGATVFPGYEFFKRFLLQRVSPKRASQLRVPLVLLAGAMATFFACIGVCPAEAVRIRTVVEGGFKMSFLAAPWTLYNGFTPLLARQVLFGMAKFLVFDTLADALYRCFPDFRRRNLGWLVSLISGATAGLIATFVSQPSDEILTRLALSPELGLIGAAASLWQEGRIGAFFTGFATRSVWAASIIAGQFLLYDVARKVFRATAADLTQTADVLYTAIKLRDPSSAPVRLKSDLDQSGLGQTLTSRSASGSQIRKRQSFTSRLSIRIRAIVGETWQRFSRRSRLRPNFLKA